MELKKYMEQPRIVAQKIRAKKNELISLRTASKQITSHMTGMPSSMDLESRVERYVIRAESLEEEIRTLEEKLLVYRSELTYLFSYVEDDRWAKVLTLRFLELMEYEEISKEMGYSNSQIYRYLRDGTNVVEPIYRKMESSMRVE